MANVLKQMNNFVESDEEMVEASVWQQGLPEEVQRTIERATSQKAL